MKDWGKTTMIENRSTTIDIFTNYDVKPIIIESFLFFKNKKILM